MRQNKIQRKKEVHIMKKILVFILCSFSILVTSKGIFAAEQEEILREAVLWAKETTDVRLQVGEVCPIKNEAGKEEYAISYFSGAMPYGYIVLEKIDSEWVAKEFSISKGCEGIYTDLVDLVRQGKTENGNVNVEPELYEIEPMQYGVRVKNKKENSSTVYDNYGNSYTQAGVYQSNGYDSAQAIFLKEENFNNNKKYQEEVNQRIILKKAKDSTTKSGYKLIDQHDCEGYAKKYACGVTAMAELCHIEGLLKLNNKKNFVVTYNTLWKYAKTKETKESKKDRENNREDIIYGDIVKGLKKFLKEKGYKNTVANTKSNPSTAWIKDKLLYNRPIIFSYGIKVNKKYSGHVINILGYKRAKKVSRGNTYNYLMVHDGWNSNSVKYINYTTVDFVDAQATYFWVK